MSLVGWLVLALVCANAAESGEWSEQVKVNAVYPGAIWRTRAPEEVGLERAQLDALRDFVGGCGCVVRHGYMVYAWGDQALRGNVYSACKPWFSHFLFKAVEEGKIPSLDQKVDVWEPRLNNLNPALGFKDRDITWRHLANQTSCYGVEEKPGTAFNYNDYQMALFWDTLFLKVYGATYDIVDAKALHPQLTDLLQCQDNPTFMVTGTNREMGRLGVSVRDFARFGLLYLRHGNWQGRQLISAEHARMAVTSPLPGSLPDSTEELAEMIPGQRTIGRVARPQKQGAHSGSYSWLWWVNGVDRDGKRRWPDAPLDTYGTFGKDGNAMIVIPSLDLVVSWSSPKMDELAAQNEGLQLVVESVRRKLTTQGNQFFLDGQPFRLWGIRTASATKDDAQTDHLLAQLDDYLAQGVNAVTVFYMGSSGGSYDPFSPDGFRIDPSHQGRMERIIRACDARGMVVIVGVFYQHAPFGFRDAEAVRDAVRTVTRLLKPYRNIVINVANEQNSRGWEDTAALFDFREPPRIIELCRIVHQEDPGRLVGGGGYDHARNPVIGASPELDVLLFDTDGPQNSGTLYDQFVAGGVKDKPIVNVEMFGGWTKRFEGGVVPASGKRAYSDEVDAAVARPGLSVFFHHSPWCQGPTAMRYDLAGDGTEKAPGIRWYFEYVSRHAKTRAAEAPSIPRDPVENGLTDEEKHTGWKLLFDGHSTEGWRGYEMKQVPEGWKALDGALVRVSGGPGGKGAGGGDDLITIEQFEDFELTLEWKIAKGAKKGGNSGILYRVTEDAVTSWHTAPEMQILDNSQYPKNTPAQLAGAVYDLYAPSKEVTRPVGKWNKVKIVVDGNHVEHWLTGEKIVEYEIGSEDWNVRIAKSKFKDMPQFAKARQGHICLQDHSDRVEFRNIKIRPLLGKRSEQRRRQGITDQDRPALRRATNAANSSSIVTAGIRTAPEKDVSHTPIAQQLNIAYHLVSPDPKQPRSVTEQEMDEDFARLKAIGFTHLTLWAGSTLARDSAEERLMELAIRKAAAHGLGCYLWFWTAGKPLMYDHPFWKTNAPPFRDKNNRPVPYMNIWNEQLRRGFLRDYLHWLGRKFAQFPNVAGYVIDEPDGDWWKWKEYGYDEQTRKQFSAWLKKRYGSLDALNNAWGEAHGGWEEVMPPRAEPPRAQVQNPASTSGQRWRDWTAARSSFFVDWFADMNRYLKEVHPACTILWSITARYVDNSEEYELADCLDWQRITPHLDAVLMAKFPSKDAQAVAFAKDVMEGLNRKPAMKEAGKIFAIVIWQSSWLEKIRPATLRHLLELATSRGFGIYVWAWQGQDHLEAWEELQAVFQEFAARQRNAGRGVRK